MASKPFKLRCKFVGGSSDKFWEVEVIDFMLITRWGRNGSAGQAQSVQMLNYAIAVSTARAKFRKKLQEGYVEDNQPSISISIATAISMMTSSSPRGQKNKAQEAVELFLKNNPQAIPKMTKAQSIVQNLLGSPKQKAKRKPKKSESPKSSNVSTKTESAPAAPSEVFLKPARKVRI